MRCHSADVADEADEHYDDGDDVRESVSKQCQSPMTIVMVMTVTERAACLSILDDDVLLTLPLHATTTASVVLLEIVTDLYHHILSAMFESAGQRF